MIRRIACIIKVLAMNNSEFIVAKSKLPGILGFKMECVIKYILCCESAILFRIDHVYINSSFGNYSLIENACSEIYIYTIYEDDAEVLLHKNRNFTMRKFK